MQTQALFMKVRKIISQTRTRGSASLVLEEESVVGERVDSPSPLTQSHTGKRRGISCGGAALSSGHLWLLAAHRGWHPLSPGPPASTSACASGSCPWRRRVANWPSEARHLQARSHARPRAHGLCGGATARSAATYPAGVLQRPPAAGSPRHALASLCFLPSVHHRRHPRMRLRRTPGHHDDSSVSAHDAVSACAAQVVPQDLSWARPSEDSRERAQPSSETSADAVPSGCCTAACVTCALTCA
eukprot:scaffold2631_cov412-Prasinococcus_capsulatus_cf.AAC.20